MRMRIRKTRNTHAAPTALASIPQGSIDKIPACRPERSGHAHALLLPLISYALTGCTQRGAPSFALFGAYFPAWMLCAFVGILASIGARVVFVATGLSNALPFQLFVCVSIGVCVALLVWLSRFA